MENIDCIIIIPVENQIEARTLLGMDGELSGHFTTGLSIDGQEPPIYYISAGYFEDETLNLLLNTNLVYKVYFGKSVNEVLEIENLKLVNINESI